MTIKKNYINAAYVALCISCVAIPANSQGANVKLPHHQEKARPSKTSSPAEPRWLHLAKIMADPKADEDKLYDVSVELYELPKAQLVQAMKYIVAHDPRQSQIANDLVSLDPSETTAQFILPYFLHLNVQGQALFLSETVGDAALFSPNVETFRRMARTAVERGKDMALSGYAASALRVGASILAVNVRPDEKALLHQALKSNPRQANLWSVLSSLNSLTEAELQVAQKLFNGKASYFQVSLAAALSSQSPEKEKFVLNALEPEIASMEGKDTRQSWENLYQDQSDVRDQILNKDAGRFAGTNKIHYLPILLFWKGDAAKKLALRCYRSDNISLMAQGESIVCHNFPDIILEQARDHSSESNKKFVNRRKALVQVYLYHPELKKEIMALLPQGQLQNALTEVQEQGLDNIYN